MAPPATEQLGERFLISLRVTPASLRSLPFLTQASTRSATSTTVRMSASSSTGTRSSLRFPMASRMSRTLSMSNMVTRRSAVI